MKEQDWKETYQREMDEVHAPDHLIELTKQKVALEENEAKNNRKKKSFLPYGIAGLSAIAAILALFILSYSLIQNREAVDKQEGTKIYLGNKTDKELYLNEQVEIERTAVLPVEFIQNEAWEEEIENTKVKICCTNEGYYVAAYEEEDAYIVIRSKEKDFEKMKQIITEILNY